MSKAAAAPARACVIFSRLALGFSGASVSSTGCSWGGATGAGVRKSTPAGARTPCLWRHSQLVVERVVPDLLHVVPVGDNAVLDWVLERQDAALALRLVAHVRVLPNHTRQHTLPPTRDSARRRPFKSLRPASQSLKRAFCPSPTSTTWWRGRPTMEENTARGASSPAKPACSGRQRQAPAKRSRAGPSLPPSAARRAPISRGAAASAALPLPWRGGRCFGFRSSPFRTLTFPEPLSHTSADTLLASDIAALLGGGEHASVTAVEILAASVGGEKYTRNS